MNKRIGVFACILTMSVFHAAAQSGDPQSAPELQSGVPGWFSFSGTLKDSTGRPVASVTEVTFAIYSDAEGGDALWTEKQNVSPEEQGRFTVLLGTTKSGGVPVDLFTRSEPRWLGIEGPGLAEQPRVLLVSVPYALRAADAQTLAGRPASDYALASAPASEAAVNAGAASKASPQTSSITGSGKPGYLPQFLTPSTLGDSLLFQSGGTLNLGGNLTLAPLNGINPSFKIEGAKGAVFSVSSTSAALKSVADSDPTAIEASADVIALAAEGSGNALSLSSPQGTASINGNAITFNAARSSLSLAGGAAILGPTGAAGKGKSFPSAALGFQASVASASGAVSTPAFAWQAAPLPSVSQTPPAALDLLISPNGKTWSQTGLSFASNGIITWAQGQKFPGSGPEAGTGLTLSNNTLSINPAVVATLGANNTWTGSNGFPGGLGSSFLDITPAAGLSLPALQINGAGGNSTTTILRANTASGDLLDITATGAGIAGSVSLVSQGALNLDGSGGAFMSNGQGLQVTANALQSISLNGGAGAQGGTGNGGGILVGNGAPGGSGGGVDIYSGSSYVSTSALTGGDVIIQTGTGYNGGAAGNIKLNTPLQPASSVSGGNITMTGSGTLVLSNTTSSNNMISTNSSLTLNSSDVLVNAAGIILTGGSTAVGATNTTLTVNGSGATVAGNLNVTGNKNAIVPATGGRMVAVHAVESPESWFEDFGSAQLHDGAARVAIDAAFLETVNSNFEYHVFLTPLGDCRGLYVAQRNAAGFEVRELGGGTANIAFDYRIVAKRRGYETERLETVPGFTADQNKH